MPVVNCTVKCTQDYLNNNPPPRSKGDRENRLFPMEKIFTFFPKKKKKVNEKTRVRLTSLFSSSFWGRFTTHPAQNYQSPCSSIGDGSVHIYNDINICVCLQQPSLTAATFADNHGIASRYRVLLAVAVILPRLPSPPFHDRDHNRCCALSHFAS